MDAELPTGRHIRAPQLGEEKYLFSRVLRTLSETAQPQAPRLNALVRAAGGTRYGFQHQRIGDLHRPRTPGSAEESPEQADLRRSAGFGSGVHNDEAGQVQTVLTASEGRPRHPAPERRKAVIPAAPGPALPFAEAVGRDQAAPAPAGSLFGPEPGGPVETYTILTAAANATVAAVHSRMPVILPPEAYGPWRPGEDIPLGPYPADDMHAHPVCTLVNRPAKEDPRCVEPVSLC